MAYYETELNRDWKFRAADTPEPIQNAYAIPAPWLPAEVPGYVHLDLLRNGVIADPHAGFGELGCAWVDEADWVYRLEFEWSPRPAAPIRHLQFDGLDTVASVFLNGEPIGTCENMFLPNSFEVTTLLMEGANVIEVHFQSAKSAGLLKRALYFEEAGLPWDTVNFEERAFLRKAQYMFGWDWGPRLISCGIWKPVRLIECSTLPTNLSVQIEHVHGNIFRVGLSDELARFRILELNAEWQSRPVEIEVERWWPNGLGPPRLYTIELESNGITQTKKIGFRTIELIREPDEFGESFQFAVNGKSFFARGANWIPNDSFLNRVSDNQLRAQVGLCQDLNFNMIRVWGGGVYEPDAFYEACDECGILVWQDFPFACSYYPENQAFLDGVEREVRYHVTRLVQHPCLALFCGNNENTMMFHDRWLDKVKNPDREHGRIIFDTVLRSIVAEVAPEVPYIPSSPCGPAIAEFVGPNTPSAGDEHFWEVWHGRGDWQHYRDSQGRFCSEFGFASAGYVPSSGELDADYHWHDKSRKPFEVIRSLVESHYPEAQNLEEWTRFSQLNQRDALRAAIEHFRTFARCAGALVWQFNDCWPANSWAVQTYDRQLKPAGNELRRLFASVLLVPRRAGDGLELLVVRDRPGQPVTVTASAVDRVSGQELARAAVFVDTGLAVENVVVFDSVSDWDATRVSVCFEAEDYPATKRWFLLCEPKNAKFSISLVE